MYLSFHVSTGALDDALRREAQDLLAILGDVAGISEAHVWQEEAPGEDFVMVRIEVTAAGSTFEAVGFDPQASRAFRRALAQLEKDLRREAMLKVREQLAASDLTAAA